MDGKDSQLYHLGNLKPHFSTDNFQLFCSWCSPLGQELQLLTYFYRTARSIQMFYQCLLFLPSTSRSNNYKIILLIQPNKWGANVLLITESDVLSVLKHNPYTMEFATLPYGNKGNVFAVIRPKYARQINNVLWHLFCWMFL